MRWVKGQSGNRHGRPKDNVGGYNIPALCRTYAADCVRLWAQIMEDESAPLGVRIKVAEMILDRAYGKPVQRANIAMDDRQPSAKELSDDDLAAIIRDGSRGATRAG